MREMARHRLRRLPFVGATRAQVRARGRRGDAQLGAGADGEWEPIEIAKPAAVEA